ncbi:MAG TPA: metallophosphoesterase [Solirubrobacteraceae bacterium]|jgi:predicted phosphodiesterase|nr:metallophosphoesterase [Solirubrobacteraceae bacterium]
MRTLLISDLHLGSQSRSDVLRDARLRAPLLSLAADADRVVLLGDVLELRHGPARGALAAAEPFFADLGAALAGRELVVVAGNHDHAVVEPWLARRAQQPARAPLALEQMIAPTEGSALLEQIAQLAAPARVVGAYPGLWVREDVYATHGHYLDCHLTVPTLERLSVAAMSRLLGRPASGFHSADDYEAVTAPVYVWRDAVARDAPTGDALNGTSTLRAWRMLRSDSDGRDAGGGANGSVLSGAARRVRTRALIAGFPLAVAALNRAGLGPLHAEVSSRELRRAGLRAMGEVAERLGLGDAYVVFGHTHRAGPLARDHEQEWRGQGAADHASVAPGGAGARLVNSGCWTYDAVFLSARPGESPYWPGTCVVVEGAGAPRLERLLADYSHEQLLAGRAAQPALT